MDIASSIAAMVTAPFRKAKVDPAALVRDQHDAHRRLVAARSILSEIGADLVAAETEASVISAFRRRAEARAAEVQAMADLSAARLAYDTVCQRHDIGGPGCLPGRF